MSRSLTVEIHRDIPALRDVWRNFQGEARGGPHDTWEWADAWARTAGKFTPPLIAIGRDASGDILFLLPLTIRKRMGCNMLEWLGGEQGNYSSGLFHPTAWSEKTLPRGKDLLALVLDTLPRFDAVHLDKQPAEINKSLNPLAGLPGIPAASAGHAFPLNADWHKYFKQKFSSHQRSKLRRSERQLCEQGAVGFEVVEQGPERSQVMDGIIAEKRKWLAQKGIPDCFAEADVRDFYRSLVQITDTTAGPATRIFTLSVDDEIVATNLGLIYQNKFYGLTASNTCGPLCRFSPGSILFLHIVEHLANEGIEMIDCGAGEDVNKLRWCTEWRERRHAIVPVSVKGAVYTAALKSLLLIKLKIKHSPQIWGQVKRLRKWKSILGAPRPSAANSTSSTVSLKA
ncbi:MAG: GNAT family N-acetyltransferase [Methyloligellaceae bacterium]